MQLKKTLIKLLIIFSFLLPFASCDRQFIGEKTEEVATDSVVVMTPDTLADSTILIADSVAADTTATINKSENIQQPDTTEIRKPMSNIIYQILFFPTENTLSALGLILLSDSVNPWLLSIMLFLSFLALLEGVIKIIQKNMVGIYVINLCCLLIFIGYVTLLNKSELRWGAFIMLGLMVLALYRELKHRTLAKATSTNTINRV